MKRTSCIIAISAFGLSLMACGSDGSRLGLGSLESPTRALKAQPPFQEVRIQLKTLVLKLRRGEPLSQVADMSQFGAMRPEMPIERIVSERGSPDQERHDHRGMFYSYHEGTKRIDVAHIVGRGWDDWSIFLYPKSIEEFMRPSVLEYVRKNAKIEEIIVMTDADDKDERLWMKGLGSDSVEVRWYVIPPGQYEE